MDKRYQVFISSTYADLKEERRRVIETVLDADCIPAGMELFPAADEEQFDYIKRVIDDCDYYLLIIGGRYGSVTQAGVSYTEQEYDYALSRRLKIIALLHESPDDISWGKSEQDPALREKLQQFRDRVATGRLVKYWKTAADLPGLVSTSLMNAIKRFPAIGWVRANRPANEDVLGEINELRKQNDQLQVQLDALSSESEPVIQNLAGLDEVIRLGGKHIDRHFTQGKPWAVEATWRQIFADVAPYLVQYPNDDYVKTVLASALLARSIFRDGSSPKLDDQQFRTVAVQLKALGLVNIEYTNTVQGGMGLFWSLTAAGERLMFELRTVRTKAASDEA